MNTPRADTPSLSNVEILRFTLQNDKSRLPRPARPISNVPRPTSHAPQSHLHLAIPILRDLLDRRGFVWRQVEQLVDTRVQLGFEGDNGYGQAFVLGTLLDQPRFPHDTFTG